MRMRDIALLLYLSLQAVDCLGGFQEYDALINVTYRRRKPVHLNCNISDLDKTTVVWKKKGFRIPLSFEGAPLFQSDKYSIRESANVSTLTVKEPGVEDAGIYVCTTIKTRAVVNRTAFSLIRAGKHYTDLIVDVGPVSAKLGGRANLMCNVRYRRNHKVMWLDPRGDPLTYGFKSLRTGFRVDSKGPKTQWTLKIKDITQLDFGHYSCMVATNPSQWETVVLKQQVDNKTRTSSQLILSSPSTTTQPPSTFQPAVENTSLNVSHENEEVEVYSGDPRTGAVESHNSNSDNWRNIVLVVCATTVVVVALVVTTVYLLNRVQKMTRKIVQQEIQCDQMRSRRRERRLTSETRVIIAQEDPAQESRHNRSNEELGLQANTYCDPWSSRSNIIKVMNFAYNQRRASEDENNSKHVQDDKQIQNPMRRSYDLQRNFTRGVYPSNIFYKESPS